MTAQPRAAHASAHNALLARLPPADLARLLPHLEFVELPLGLVLYESGSALRHAYFPTSAIASLHYVTESGASSELAGVGSEGMVGMPIILGGNATPSAAVIVSAGHGYKIERQRLVEEFARAAGLQTVLLRYAQALLTHISQTAACNRHHSVQQQLCRWLLETLDRIPSGELTMTHELIASVIGVRREGISEAASKLQNAGTIRYRRGHISVLNRAGLEAQVCECYGVVRGEFSRLLDKTIS